MKTHFEFHPDFLLVLPCVALQNLECEDCGEDNGCAVSIGFLMFSLVFHFFPHEDADDSK